MIYKLYKTDPFQNSANAVMTVGSYPEKSFLFDPANTDYQEYLKFLAEGGQPEPADQPE